MRTKEHNTSSCPVNSPRGWPLSAPNRIRIRRPTVPRPLPSRGTEQTVRAPVPKRHTLVAHPAFRARSHSVHLSVLSAARTSGAAPTQARSNCGAEKARRGAKDQETQEQGVR
jgi:hypothetical protein